MSMHVLAAHINGTTTISREDSKVMESCLLRCTCRTYTVLQRRNRMCLIHNSLAAEKIGNCACVNVCQLLHGLRMYIVHAVWASDCKIMLWKEGGRGGIYTWSIFLTTAEQLSKKLLIIMLDVRSNLEWDMPWTCRPI